MALHSMKLTHFAGAALLLGALAPPTWAQTTSIVPAGQSAAPAPGTAVPTRVAPALPASAQPMTDVSFRDIEVTEVLNMISQGFDVPMVIASDVRGIILPAINLPNKTPDAAIQAITAAAGLRYRKQADGTYLIAKTLPDDPTIPPATSAITLPGNSANFGNPFGTGSSSALPDLSNGAGNLESGANNGFEMPQLVGEGARTERKRMQQIRLRNVPPSLMAYWIDPANNEMPIQLQSARNNQSRYGANAIAQATLSDGNQFAASDEMASSLNPGVASGFNTGSVNPYTQQRSNAEVRSSAQFGRGGRGGNRGGRGGARGGGGGASGVFTLPEGVDQIVAIDPQNALLVFGTDEGVRELTETIQFLDRPLRQVEIEAQFVSVNTNDTDAFGINYNTSQGNFNASATGFAPAPPTTGGSLQVGFVRGSFQATLSALISTNRAKILTAPRVLAINNLTASLQSTQTTPIILTSSIGGIGGQVATSQRVINVSTTIGLTVTPTINNDDTITVLMQPEVSTQNAVPGQTIPSFMTQSLETIANVKDGDTIALGGLKTKKIARGTDKIPILSDIPLLGKLFRSRSATGQETDLIIFLTARIVRRADDDAAVPGT